MPKIVNVEKKIWDVDGFEVKFKHPEGKDVRGDLSIGVQYAFENAAKNDYTVKEWKDKRFSATFTGYKVDVLNADGSVADGRTKLSNVRDTYLDD